MLEQVQMGSNFNFGIKENNYLGRGVKVDSNLMVSEKELKENL